MESRVTVLGHSAHQVLVPLPIGLLIGSIGMDLWGWSRDDPSWTVAAHRMMGIRVLSLTTWFGGEMVARLGVGVSPRAHVNAPSSLRTERSARTLSLR